MSGKKTAIVTGASGGIGAGLVEEFLKLGYSVVATSLNASRSFTASPSLVVVDGDIGKQEIAAKVADAAIKHFGTIDVLVNNAGIFYVKPFTEFTTEDFNALVSVNLFGFIHIAQLAVKQMLKQRVGVRREHHRVAGRSTHCRCECLGLDDYEGRAEYSDPPSCDRVRKGRHPLQRRSAGHRGYATAQERSQGPFEDVAADGENCGDQRCG